MKFTDALAEEFSSTLQGQVLRPSDAEYDRARRVVNKAVERRPAVIVICADENDVQQCVRFARRTGLRLSVKAGAHDAFGRALNDGGIVIDLSVMNRVVVDSAEKTAKIGGGVRAGDLLKRAAEYGLVAVTGTVSDVGMGGLLLGGGYGQLTGKFGLASDNLLNARVVLADGSIVDANANQNADLFWAIRGGGGGFGVAVEFTLCLHELTEVLSGPLVFGLDEAEGVLAAYNSFMRSSPDALGLNCGFLTGPNGKTGFALLPLWIGDTEAGQTTIEPLRAFGHPVMDAIRPQGYLETFAIADSHVSRENKSHWRTNSLGNLDSTSIKILVDAAESFPSPESAILISDFHGAATRVHPEATAFAQRQPHFMIQVAGNWSGTEEGLSSKVHQWVEDTYSKLAAQSLPGGYINFMSQDESSRARSSFGGNLDRLTATKRKYDEFNLFNSAPGIV